MRHAPAGLLLALLVLGLVPGAAAQVIDLPRVDDADAAVDDGLPAPAELIERHVEATGGRAAWEKLRTRRTTGTLRQGEGPGWPLEIRQSVPNNRHVVLDMPGDRRRYVTNGEESWTYEGDVLVASGGDQRIQEIRRAAFDLMLQWSEHYLLSKTLGLEDVEGRPAYRVRLLAEDCHPLYLSFDRETGRLVRMEEETVYAGERIDSDTLLGDYREFDGVLLPTRSIRTMLYQGRRTVQFYETESVEHNIALPEGLFATPPELRPAAG
ncbi:MAG: hypothetical protein ACYTG1_06195 [Planctomycetota bacterium]|jgi:hypothetical protein